jgi:hypothetical protein
MVPKSKNKLKIKYFFRIKKGTKVNILKFIKNINKEESVKIPGYNKV